MNRFSVVQVLVRRSVAINPEQPNRRAILSFRYEPYMYSGVLLGAVHRPSLPPSIQLVNIRRSITALLFLFSHSYSFLFFLLTRGEVAVLADYYESRLDASFTIFPIMLRQSATRALAIIRSFQFVQREECGE